MANEGTQAGPVKTGLLRNKWKTNGVREILQKEGFVYRDYIEQDCRAGHIGKKYTVKSQIGSAGDPSATMLHVILKDTGHPCVLAGFLCQLDTS